MPTGNSSTTGRGGVEMQPLERRMLQSVSTTTRLTPSDTSYRFGDTVDLNVTVKAARGTAAGAVQLYSGTKNTGIGATLNSSGKAVFEVDASRAFLTGKYSFSARYVPKGTFAASKSKLTAVRVITPTVDRTTSDGISLSTLTIGSGASVARGNTITAQISGYDNRGKLIASSFAAAGGIAKYRVLAKPEQVVKGLDEALVGMRVGETLVVKVPAKLAYNDGRTLLYVLHLVGITR